MDVGGLEVGSSAGLVEPALTVRVAVGEGGVAADGFVGARELAVDDAEDVGEGLEAFDPSDGLADGDGVAGFDFETVLDEVTQWQSRPLERCYPVVIFDALRVKIRDEGTVRTKAVYLALGITPTGSKDVLGLWIEQSEGAKFWQKVVIDGRNRGPGIGSLERHRQWREGEQRDAGGCACQLAFQPNAFIITVKMSVLEI